MSSRPQLPCPTLCGHDAIIFNKGGPQAHFGFFCANPHCDFTYEGGSIIFAPDEIWKRKNKDGAWVFIKKDAE